ncbi:hypothetical protein [Streptomyces sp. B6B3]|uniref:hypothetical protein n=1 Tax=Streptomyces sp. B6B3 TaxID=3153570 RepID=UPI00325DE1B9
MIDWAALFGGALFGFLGGMVTAWRVASVEAAKAWAGDLRHRFKVKQADREKTQQLRHAQLDHEHHTELQHREDERKQIERAREDERRRIKRAHTELKKALQRANKAVGTHTSAEVIKALQERGNVPPQFLLEEIKRFDEHRALLKELQGSLEDLSGLGISISHSITNWHSPLQSELSNLAKAITLKTEQYATLISQPPSGS